jgi:uncharacterized coiled-coil protein SlyX
MISRLFRRYFDHRFHELERSIALTGARIMATIDQAVADLKQEISDLGTQMDANFQALKEALAANDPTKVQAIADELEADVQALKDIGTRDTNPAPTVAGGGTPTG